MFYRTKVIVSSRISCFIDGVQEIEQLFQDLRDMAPKDTVECTVTSSTSQGAVK